MKVTIFGCAGWNIGDEAIAVASARILKQYEPSLEVVVTSSCEGALASRYAGITELFLDRRTLAGWKTVNQVIRQSDAVVLGGGTIIQDALGISPFRGTLPYMLQIAYLAKLYRKPLLTLPIGVDELGTRLGVHYARRALGACDSLTVRDAASRALAEKYTCAPIPTPHIGADPAFALDDVPLPAPVNANLFASNRPYVAISLVRERLVVHHFLDAVSCVIQRLLDSSDYDVVLVPFDRRPTDELSVFPQLIEAIPASLRHRVTMAHPQASCHEMAQILRRSQLVLAMRLHAMILALGHVPIVALSRTTKTDTFAALHQIPHFNVNDQVDPSALSQSVMQQLQSRGRPSDLHECHRRTECERARQALKRVTASLREQSAKVPQLSLTRLSWARLFPFL